MNNTAKILAQAIIDGTMEDMIAKKIDFSTRQVQRMYRNYFAYSYQELKIAHQKLTINSFVDNSIRAGLSARDTTKKLGEFLGLPPNKLSDKIKYLYGAPSKQFVTRRKIIMRKKRITLSIKEFDELVKQVVLLLRADTLTIRALALKTNTSVAYVRAAIEEANTVLIGQKIIGMHGRNNTPQGYCIVDDNDALLTLHENWTANWRLANGL